MAVYTPDVERVLCVRLDTFWGAEMRIQAVSMGNASSNCKVGVSGNRNCQGLRLGLRRVGLTHHHMLATRA